MFKRISTNSKGLREVSQYSNDSKRFQEFEHGKRINIEIRKYR